MTLYQAVQLDVERQVLAFFGSLEKEEAQGRLALGEAVERWIRWSQEFLTRHPHLGRLELRWFLEGGTPGRPDDVARVVAPLRLIAALLQSHMPPDRAEDAALVVLLVTAAGLVVFSDSPTQQALLGGSVLREASVRARIARFAQSLITDLIEKEGTS